jgi:hypothetical protein
MNVHTLTCLCITLLLSATAAAQQAKTYGDYTVYYSVVTTTFLEPDVAAAYQIVRATDEAIINIAIRKRSGDSDVAVPALIEGRSWDLFQNRFLEFREIREQGAIYYIANFDFSSEEHRFFNLNILPQGAERSFELIFKQRIYED